MRSKTVVVLGGGWSGERPISLLSMRGVVKALRGRGWHVRAFDLLPEGPLRMAPLASPAGVGRLKFGRLVPTLTRLKPHIVFLAMHGPIGEDGRLQGVLDLAGLPYTGSGALTSALAMDKALAKQILRQAGVRVPDGFLMRRGQPLPKGIKYPVFCKPLSQGSSLGVTLCENVAGLKTGLRSAWHWEDQALVEPCIRGRELAVSILGGRALPIVEITPEHAFYDFHSKYAQGGSRHQCPAQLTPAQTKQVQAIGLAAHQALGCKGFSRVDVILDKNNKAWVLEVNTLPGLTDVSLLPDAARAAGMDYATLLERVMALSLKEPLWRSTKV